MVSQVYPKPRAGWFADEDEFNRGTYNIMVQQEDGTFGELTNGLVLEDVLNRLGDSEAIWTNGSKVRHISRPVK